MAKDAIHMPREPHSYSSFFHQGQVEKKEEQLMYQQNWAIQVLSTQQEQTQTLMTGKSFRVKQEPWRKGEMRCQGLWVFIKQVKKTPSLRAGTLSPFGLRVNQIPNLL